MFVICVAIVQGNSTYVRTYQHNSNFIFDFTVPICNRVVRTYFTFHEYYVIWITVRDRKFLIRYSTVPYRYLWCEKDVRYGIVRYLSRFLVVFPFSLPYGTCQGFMVSGYYYFRLCRYASFRAGLEPQGEIILIGTVPYRTVRYCTC